MRPFFMNVVSDSNHWLFISSNGGITAGRKNNSYSLFPYYTDDKITESADITGSKTIFRVQSGEKEEIWEPFSERYTGKYKLTRNLYKNFFGNKIMFEEINHNLMLTYRYQWNTSRLFGFVRRSELINQSGKESRITVLDGIQNILPYGVEPEMQTASSNLVDAYKRNERVRDSGLGIYALSAIITDKAEPSEALKANVAWSLGIQNPTYLLSSLQLNRFRNSQEIEEEKDIKGEKGAYFVHTEMQLEPDSSHNWMIIADVNQSHTQIIGLNKRIVNHENSEPLVLQDIERGTENLKHLVAAADGLRVTSDPLKDARHYSNVLFNIMRGGVFDHHYLIGKKDLTSYLRNASRDVYSRNATLIHTLDDQFSRSELFGLIQGIHDPDLKRLCREYLPLKFSRRHGDPSRPWNYFTINTENESDGSKILDYEGNWRDIFQNWEALVHSYPGFIDGMVFKFLNTSTFDGYNPYRVTKGGFDWETIEPDNPWSYIGYWGDHQIIYLLKLLEFYHAYQPDSFGELFGSEYFVYANVPYRIKPYDQIAKDPKHTIDFDVQQDREIRENVASAGADAALLRTVNGDIHRVNFSEKILATLLARLSNFIPEGGIWMNTQRPEWNDANNALVGNGVSMVTLYYLRRFLKFFQRVLADISVEQIQISEELHHYFVHIRDVLIDHQPLLEQPVSDANRKQITDALGRAGSQYRHTIYGSGFSGRKATLNIVQFSGFIDVALLFMEHSIKANRRKDNLYHSYNIMSMNDEGISLSYLSEMLEGQVAALSSGFTNPDEALLVLDALRNSPLYREDQNSYILYPNKELPRFLEKNNIPEASVRKSKLFQKLVQDGNHHIIIKDAEGGYHFNGNFRNAADLKAALDELSLHGYSELVDEESGTIQNIFEEVFHHKAFTGRSGTFFAYEGLGSIYWHMVSKLHMAVSEVCYKAFKEESDDETKKGLLSHFYDIGEGIGIHKSPELHGTFPTDAYSHTPAHRGAQQPGMTGQVKEDILTSLYEIGVFIRNGKLCFDPILLRKKEFRTEPGKLQFIHTDRETAAMSLPAKTLCISFCQIPVILKIGKEEMIEVTGRDGNTQRTESLCLDTETSTRIFERTGEIRKLTVSVPENRLQ